MSSMEYEARRVVVDDDVVDEVCSGEAEAGGRGWKWKWKWRGRS